MSHDLSHDLLFLKDPESATPLSKGHHEDQGAIQIDQGQSCGQKKVRHVWCSPKGMWETPQSYGRRYSGQRLTFCFLVIKENSMSGANPPPITPRKASPQWSMVVAASCCGDVLHRQGLGNWSELKKIWMALKTGKFLRETCLSSRDLRLGRRFTFQQDNDPKHTAKETLKGNI